MPTARHVARTGPRIRVEAATRAEAAAQRTTTTSSPGALSTAPTPSAVQATIWTRLPSPSWPGGVAQARRPSRSRSRAAPATSCGRAVGSVELAGLGSRWSRLSRPIGRIGRVGEPDREPGPGLVPADVEVGDRAVADDGRAGRHGLGRHPVGQSAQRRADRSPGDGRAVVADGDGAVPDHGPVAGRVDDRPPARTRRARSRRRWPGRCRTDWRRRRRRRASPSTTVGSGSADCRSRARRPTRRRRCGGRRDGRACGVADAPDVDVRAGGAVGGRAVKANHAPSGEYAADSPTTVDVADDREGAAGRSATGSMRRGSARSAVAVGVGVGLSADRTAATARRVGRTAVGSAGRRRARGRGRRSRSGVGVGVGAGVGVRIAVGQGDDEDVVRRRIRRTPTTTAWLADRRGDDRLRGPERQGDLLDPCRRRARAQSGCVGLGADLVDVRDVVGEDAVRADVEPADLAGVDGDRRRARDDRDVRGGRRGDDGDAGSVRPVGRAGGHVEPAARTGRTRRRRPRRPRSRRSRPDWASGAPSARAGRRRAGDRPPPARSRRRSAPTGRAAARAACRAGARSARRSAS